MQTKQPNGYVIYRGPSLINGEPIVAIALTAKHGSDANRKTGDIVQTYILADNGVKPTANLSSGADESVCGDCKHRPILGGACYVVVAQGPTVVWKGFTAGKYPALTASRVAPLIAGRMVRLGTYGDPAAVPAHVWQALLTHAPKHSGYTHQWQKPGFSAQHAALKALVMASCDTPEERDTARANGWRTFTIRTADEPIAERESVCPASEEAGKKLTCAQCAMCDGAAGGRKGSIAIIAHGFKASRYIAMRKHA